MLFDLVCDLQGTELNLTAEKPLTSLTGRSASCGKCCLQTWKRSTSDIRNGGTVFDLQASAISGFFRVNLCTVALAFCRLQSHESGRSCQVTATSGWGRSSPSQWEVFRRTVSEGLCHIKAKLLFKWFRNTLIQDQESAHIFDRVKED